MLNGLQLVRGVTMKMQYIALRKKTHTLRSLTGCVAKIHQGHIHSPVSLLVTQQPLKISLMKEICPMTSPFSASLI